MLDDARKLSARVIAKADRESADRPRGAQRRDHVRCAAARRNADDRVARFHRLAHLALAGLRIVFRAFNRTRQSRFAARDMPLYESRPRTESRRHLRRIQDAQPSAASGPDIMQPPPETQTLDDRVNRSGNTA